MFFACSTTTTTKTTTTTTTTMFSSLSRPSPRFSSSSSSSSSSSFIVKAEKFKNVVTARSISRRERRRTFTPPSTKQTGKSSRRRRRTCVTATNALDADDDAPFAYPSGLDIVPAFVGGLNPVNSFLFYFTGAVMTQGTTKTTAQWTVFVVLPVLCAMYFVRKWRYEARMEQEEEKERRTADAVGDGKDDERSQNRSSGSGSNSSSSSSRNSNAMSYSRSMRGRWLDVHVCYAFLLPAGISAGVHSSYWLVLAPAFMLYRFLFSDERGDSGRYDGATTLKTTTKRGLFSSSSPVAAFLSPVSRGWSTFVLILRRAHKYAKIVFASLALALLVVSGSATLHQSLSALNGGGLALRVLLSPFAIGVAFLGYFAPAALLPRYISRVFSRKITTDDAETKAPLTEEERAKLELKQETEKKNRKWWLLIGFIAMGISAFTGSDLPIVLAFAAQLLKANPDALLTAMAEKGGMVEFETKIADAFDRVVLSKKRDQREGDVNNGDDASKKN